MSENSDNEVGAMDETAIVTKQLYKVALEVGHIGDQLEPITKHLQDLQSSLASLQNSNSLLESRLIEARMEKQEAIKSRSKWRLAMIEYLDSIEQLLSSSELKEQWIQPYVRCKEDLIRTLKSLGVERVVPAVGEPVDERIHKIIRWHSAPLLDSQITVQTIRPGYFCGEELIRATEIVAGGPNDLDSLGLSSNLATDKKTIRSSKDSQKTSKIVENEFLALSEAALRNKSST